MAHLAHEYKERERERERERQGKIYTYTKREMIQRYIASGEGARQWRRKHRQKDIDKQGDIQIYKERGNSERLRKQKGMIYMEREMCMPRQICILYYTFVVHSDHSISQCRFYNDP